ncbi:2-oxo-4-hydroxy-4-carboxy-5-ureidoimidazoline decarboxylase [Nocardioides sp. YR527]|uniref:2-oxo-4-hydroxy-4-carboxy-5-ureidoimidazoline decarboxylase n=1 Tax=Nocardioides sp. YR527 TaxID=1881028 RepID=UPI0008915343|nr:2-oxo-4-hydroxy-4-carboxy-5-ureidoimidazoline decarboxylase [Nocardioides sp. YR527]SDK78248.1 2-oxo-4-hydroxy-4-carboxy-5-ureidoimidazoline decarboxylase [Nocardioides sp. YR527]
MTLAEFDALPADEAESVVVPCVAIPSWAAGLVARRPYADVGDLLAAAERLAAAWTDEEVEGALADHPRIGERHAGDGESATLSAREQAGVDPADAEVQARLRAGNAAYEKRFGRIYLVRAAGRSAEEMLALLEERLENDPATEITVTRGQLAEIALLRLRGLIT